MIKRIEDLNYYELLEVSTTATSQEIHRAYERIRRVYEPNSIALYSLFSAEESAAIQQRIEEAYRTLVYEENRKRYDAMLAGQDLLPELPKPPKENRYELTQVQPTLSLPSENRYLSSAAQQRQQPRTEPEQPKPAMPAPAPVAQFIAEFTGPAIRMLREQRGLSLRNVSDMTKVSVRYLELIEEENFAKLPVRAYTRGFLILYARVLGCEPERMAAEYLKRLDTALKPPQKK